VLQRIGLAAVLGILAAPALALGQYGDPYGAAPPSQVMTPFAPGPAFNPMLTPEWQQAGGNFEAWQRLMMQKMASQEQAAFQQQTQAYQAWAKANPKEAAALEKAYRAQMDPGAANPAARRSTSKKKATTKAAPKTAKGAKPPAKAAQPAAAAPDEATDTAAAPTKPAATSKLKAARQG
jgi:hypothetical protein